MNLQELLMGTYNPSPQDLILLNKKWNVKFNILNKRTDFITYHIKCIR